MGLDASIDDDHLVALDIFSCRFLFELGQAEQNGNFGYGYWNGLGRELPYDDGMDWITTIPGKVPSLWKQWKGSEILHARREMATL